MNTLTLIKKQIDKAAICTMLKSTSPNIGVDCKVHQASERLVPTAIVVALTLSDTQKGYKPSLFLSLYNRFTNFS